MAANKKNRRMSLKKKILATLLLSTLTVSAASLASSMVVLDLIFDRNDLGEDPMDLNYGDVDPIRYARSGVRFASGDNMLTGYVYGVGNKAGLVVIAQGINARPDGHLAETLYFVEHGWMVMTFDGTGTRESEGDGVVGLPQAKLDVDAALDFVAQNAAFAGLPVVLYGHSLGAYASAASLPGHPEVRAAVCISGFNSPVETMRAMAKQYIGVLADVEYPFLKLQSLLTFGPEADVTAVSSINACQTPLLIIQGASDDVVPEAISIYGHRDEIANPNASCLSVDEPYRGEHSTIWLSQRAAEYSAALDEKLDELEDQYDGHIPDDVLAAFHAQIDKGRLSELDAALMERILSFFEEAARA